MASPGTPGVVGSSRGGVLTRALLGVAVALFASGPLSPAAADDRAPGAASARLASREGFKLSAAFYGVGKEPLTSAELVFRDGNGHYFASESPEEVIIINPANKRVELLDLDRRIQGEMTFSRLDQRRDALHRSLDAAIKKQEEAGGRSNRISAEMSRALTDPALAETFDPAAARLTLTNRVVAVDATGEPEPDAARLALIDTALTSLINLASVRNPEAIPPFIRLAAVHALTVGHHLRPTELAFTYRLAGPPRKHRWTYRLTDSLTPREHEALDRVTRLRVQTPFVPFERYQNHETEDKAKGKKPSP